MYVELETPNERDQPLWQIREAAIAALADLSGEYAALCPGMGWPSIALSALPCDAVSGTVRPQMLFR